MVIVQGKSIRRRYMYTSKPRITIGKSCKHHNFRPPYLFKADCLLYAFTLYPRVLILNLSTWDSQLNLKGV